MPAALDYLVHLGRESARFAEALRTAPSEAPVPSCPGWTADDLLWHLAEVQWFWGTIVRDRLAEPAPAEARKPPRPADRTGLAELYERASHDLADVLAATTPDTQAWTWSDDQTVGFIRRRQAHEALIHRVDAELTAADRTPMDPGLAADGVDEVLRVMYGGAPPWGDFTAEPAKTVRVQATDTGDAWLVTLGRLTGTDPDGNTAVDVADVRVAEADAGGAVAATIRGGAADLDCWLWHRPAIGPVERSGDRQILGEFESTIAAGID